MTGAPVSISPPSERSSEAIAPVIAADPPTATGQPTPCPSICSISANAAVPRFSSGCIACAALPATSARAGSVANRARASPAAERIASSPNLPVAIGWRGGRRGGPSRSSISARQSRAAGPISLR